MIDWNQNCQSKFQIFIISGKLMQLKLMTNISTSVLVPVRKFGCFWMTVTAVKTLIYIWYYQTPAKIMLLLVIKWNIEESGFNLFLTSVKLNPNNNINMNPTAQHIFYKKLMYLHKNELYWCVQATTVLKFSYISWFEESSK